VTAAVRDRVRDQPHQVVALDPGHPLPARSDRSTEAELERRQQPAQHAAVDAEHQADAQAHARVPCRPAFLGGTLPRRRRHDG